MENILEKNINYLPIFEENPVIHPTATIRNSIIEGKVIIEEEVHIVNAAIRADEGTPFYISRYSNIQDMAVLHAFYTQCNGEMVESNNIFVEKKGYFAIFIDEYVSISHGVLLHGPCYIGKNSFVGFKASIDSSIIGANVEIGAHSYIKGISIPDNTAIAAGSIIHNESDIDKYRVMPTNVNKKIVEVNIQLARKYNRFNKNNYADQ